MLNIKKPMRKNVLMYCFFILLAGMLPTQGHSQLLVYALSFDYDHEDGKTFYSIKEALKTPKEVRKLSISYRELTEFPPSIELFTNLEVLDLGGNQLTTIPSSICNLTKLHFLDISRNELTSLPENIGALTSLQTFDFSGNKISKLPESFSNLKNIVNLGAGFNRLSEIPDALSNMPNLEILMINGNSKIAEINPSLRSCSKLDHLELSGANLRKIPSWISKLEHLRYLNLNSNSFQTFPVSICAIPNLEVLLLAKCKFSIVPKEIGELQKLKALHLYEMKLDSIHPAIGNLHNLMELNLQSTQLAMYPSSLKNLQKLKELDLSENQLYTIPSFIPSLTNLEVLDLGRNFLGAVEHKSRPLHLPNPVNVPKKDNSELNIFPESFFNLKNLTKIYLYKNSLTSIPVEIASFIHLKELFIWDNSFNYRKERKKLRKILPKECTIDDFNYDY